MSGAEKWWSAWAPYWEHIENRHFNLRSIEMLLDAVVNPVLVIGAGHGLIVQYLKDRGFVVDGVDRDPDMAAMAKSRRHLELILADARRLPIADRQYKTVIISSGVIDYQDDPAIIQPMLDEAYRVLLPAGNLFVAFYQIVPRVAALYRGMGVLDDREFRMARIFDIDATRKRRPVECLPKISRWTGKNRFRSFLALLRAAVFLPKEMKADSRNFEQILDRAAQDGVSAQTLLDSIPDRVPFRNEAAIQALLVHAGYGHNEVYRQDDCLFYRIFKADAAERAEASANGRPDFIRTNRLTKQYAGASTTAVDALTLGIAKGEIFGLLGPNGAGKTTTLSMLCGLLEPDSGRIEYDATINRRTVRRAIGYVPQSLALYPRLTARENLVFFGRLYGRRGKKLQRRIDDLLALVGLTERADESVKRYSTGMMRRLNLAAGLVHEPEILFLDEPTVGIDPQSRHWIFNLILDLKRKGLTILYTTHYLDEAARLCDRVAIMDRGRVLLEGAPKQIVARYGLYRLDFTAPSCPDRFTKALAQLDGVADVTCGGDGLSVYAKNAQGKMAILDTIHELAERHGVALSLQNLIEPNLESLFLDLTGKRLRDAEQE